MIGLTPDFLPELVDEVHTHAHKHTRTHTHTHTRAHTHTHTYHTSEHRATQAHTPVALIVHPSKYLKINRASRAKLLKEV